MSTPDLWNSPPVLRALSATLAFATGDDWRFVFTPGFDAASLDLGLDRRVVYREPDAVYLFSGGIDSLCAAVEAAAQGKRPVLVSHQPEGRVEHRQQALVAELRRHFPQWEFPHTGLEIHKSNARESDFSQRTRGFLYASLGTAAAHALDLSRVVLADNGIVSLNLPVNDQLIGTLASRSTHPQFLQLFNRLVAAALTNPPTVHNPLLFRTRAETLQVLQETRTAHLLADTRSCASGMRLPTEAPQCGVCSQCVDRRFAVLVAGLEGADPVRGYTTDLFLDDLHGAARTMAESYVRFARENKDRGADALVDAYPQLGDAVPSNDPQPAATMRMLCGLVQRQCQSVWSVAERQVAAARAGRTAKPPGADSLLGLLLRQQGVPLLPPALPGLRLSPEEQRDADRYGFKATEPIVLTGITTKRASNVVQIGQRSAEIPDTEFRLLLRLVVALFETKDGYVERGRMMRGGGIIAEGIYREESMEQVTSVLRTQIKPAFVGLGGTDIIEVSRGRVRLSTHPRLVSVRRSLLLKHPDALIRAWAERLPEAAEDRAPA